MGEFKIIMAVVDGSRVDDCEKGLSCRMGVVVEAVSVMACCVVVPEELRVGDRLGTDSLEE